MDPDSDVIVLDTDRKFNAAQWIGTGKIYKNVPIEVSDAFTDATKIPKTLRATLPNPAISVTEFLAIKLPGLLEKPVGQIHDWFSTDLPNCDPIPTLWALKSVPPRFFVAELIHGLPQEWLNGAKSICDPRQPSLRLPLCALRFFEQIHNLHQAQEKWANSVDWARDEAGHDTAIFSTVSWDATHFGAPDGQLDWTRLVDDEWLSDSIMDAMMADLQSRATDPTVIVAPLSFQRAIIAAATHENPSVYSVKLLEEYKRSLEAGKSKIYFPLHVNGNHWIAFMIDFVKRVFGFGDSSDRLYLGVVLGIYKYGSVSGKHESFTDAETVVGLSYLSLKVYEQVHSVGPNIDSISAGDNGWELWAALTSDPAALEILHLDGADEYSDDGEPDYEEPEEGSKKRRPKAPRGGRAGPKKRKLGVTKSTVPKKTSKRAPAGKGKARGRGGK
ncbi:hypothetical protein C8R46DRAFT_1270204 [Mycena filopes]|nr:hypothetical protein C8R46DRAFT_1270204 [Mycena filopes]